MAAEPEFQAEQQAVPFLVRPTISTQFTSAILTEI